MQLDICHLYKDLMNLYGDVGNMLSLVRRCEWRGINVNIHKVALQEKVDFKDFDLLFIGGCQDKEQRIVAEDLHANKGESIRSAVEDGLVVLAICAGYQLFGKSYITAAGEKLMGIGVFDAWTTPGKKRLIGNIVVESEIDGRKRKLVGFENHGGQTFIGSGVKPLGKVVKGYGNNGEDAYEGCYYKNAFGTYLHGPLLPKNPWFADHLIKLALLRRYPDAHFSELDDEIENKAFEAALELSLRK